MHTSVVSRANLNPRQWNDAVESHQLGWWWHTSHWIEYSLAYTPESHDESFALVAPGGAIVALVPLVVSTGGKLVMGGQTTPAPLLHVIDAQMAEAAEAEARRRYDGHLPLPIQLRPGARPYGTPPAGISRHSIATYVVDLKPDEKELWKHIRKSYKNLINRADRYDDGYSLKVCGRNDAAWAVRTAHGLHIQCAGGEMRSARTWELMESWATGGNALVAIASNATASAVGYAYAIRYKQWAYYASGGSLVNDVQHALQWVLIKALRCDGVTAYELGYAVGPKASVKDKGIAHFKAGFGSTPLVCTVLAPESWRPA
jgi:hypothetical protein